MAEENIWTYEQISRPHLKLLRFLALIPFEGKTFDSIGNKLLDIYWHINIFIYNSMFFGYGVRMISRKSFEIDYMSEQIMLGNISLRYILFFIKRKKFSKLMEMCKELWPFLTPEESRIVRTYERKAYYFWIIILISSFLAVTLYIITAAFIKLPSNVINGTEIKMLPFRFYVDVQEEPFFTIVSIFQSIVTCNIAIIGTGTETAGLYLILIACGYFRSVQHKLILLMEIQEKPNQKKDMINISEFVYNDIINCIKFHQQLLIFSDGIERFMRTIYFVGIFITIYSISMIGLSLLQDSHQSPKFLTLLLINVMQFFYCQWSPEFLLTESGAIAKAAYFASLKQFGQQKEINRILHFLILRAQKPMQLTAGGYIKLSMENFGSMAKNAISFFTLLRNFNI